MCKVFTFAKADGGKGYMGVPYSLLLVISDIFHGKDEKG